MDGEERGWPMGWVDYWEADLSPTPPLLQLIFLRLPLQAIFGETFSLLCLASLPYEPRKLIRIGQVWANCWRVDKLLLFLGFPVIIILMIKVLRESRVN